MAPGANDPRELETAQRLQRPARPVQGPGTSRGTPTPRTAHGLLYVPDQVLVESGRAGEVLDVITSRGDIFASPGGDVDEPLEGLSRIPLPASVNNEGRARHPRGAQRVRRGHRSRSRDAQPHPPPAPAGARPHLPGDRARGDRTQRSTGRRRTRATARARACGWPWSTPATTRSGPIPRRDPQPWVPTTGTHGSWPTSCTTGHRRRRSSTRGYPCQGVGWTRCA